MVWVHLRHRFIWRGDYGFKQRGRISRLWCSPYILLAIQSYGVQNSLGTEGGLYSNGTNIFLRAYALQFDPYYQEQ
ncbi:MAG: hypothetical protein EZS28_041833 [Streblomastix strix]|uniref:Uncharacterized protein n=1 Tax=Streblomastix strix TaxID=222440 RepID=A0A5J4TX50_9EUKA|nr:MAG: hypothetical protein EZS28_041833 [Streblomastix strix]